MAQHRLCRPGHASMMRLCPIEEPSPCRSARRSQLPQVRRVHGPRRARRVLVVGALHCSRGERAQPLRRIRSETTATSVHCSPRGRAAKPRRRRPTTTRLRYSWGYLFSCPPDRRILCPSPSGRSLRKRLYGRRTAARADRVAAFAPALTIRIETRVVHHSVRSRGAMNRTSSPGLFARESQVPLPNVISARPAVGYFRRTVGRASPRPAIRATRSCIAGL